MKQYHFPPIAKALTAAAARRTVLKGFGSLAALLPMHLAGSSQVAAAPAGQEALRVPVGQPVAAPDSVASQVGSAPTQRKLVIAVRIYPYGKQLR